MEDNVKSQKLISGEHMSRKEKSENDNCFAAVLVRLLNERKVELSDLADATDVPLTTLIGWRFGVNPFSQSQVGRVCRFFGITRDYIYEGEKADQEAQAQIIALRDKLTAAEKDAEIWKFQTTFLEELVKEQREEIKHLKAV